MVDFITENATLDSIVTISCWGRKERLINLFGCVDSHRLEQLIQQRFEFETSRAASSAKVNDFVYSLEYVKTDEILCNVPTHLHIDFRLTTVSAANAAIHAMLGILFMTFS